jgi:hypothetical protein
VQVNVVCAEDQESRLDHRPPSSVTTRMIEKVHVLSEGDQARIMVVPVALAARDMAGECLLPGGVVRPLLRLLEPA